MITKAEDLPLQENVYLKKSFGEWRVVHPIRNEDGSLNWMNFLFGGKTNLIILIFIMLVLGMFYIGVNQLISSYKDVNDNPCNYCKECQQVNKPVTYYNLSINYEKEK